MQPLTIKVWVLHLTPQDPKIVASTQKIINQPFILSFLDNSEISINMCGDHFCARARVAVVAKAQDPTSKENPPTCCLISYEAKGVVYHTECSSGTLLP